MFGPLARDLFRSRRRSLFFTVLLLGFFFPGFFAGLPAQATIVVPTASAPDSAAAGALSTDACASAWLSPVDAPLVDGYRPPADRYSAGNRGLEYGTVGGESVTAVAGGDVTFAGPVGASRFVVVGHPSGIRSTYAYVGDIAVTVGEVVAAGQQVALAAPGFHLTARVGAQYRDPTPLLVGSCFTVKLVPIPAGL